jgi:hypothetical protein
MIRYIDCAEDPDAQLTFSYRREPDDGKYHNALLSVYDAEEAVIHLTPETAAELINYLAEFIRIMEGREP